MTINGDRDDGDPVDTRSPGGAGDASDGPIEDGAEDPDQGRSEGAERDAGLSRRPWRRLIVVSAVLAVVCGAALAWALMLRHDEQVRSERATAAVRVATEQLELMANLGHGSAAEVMAELRSGATGEFRRQLEEIGDPLFGLLEQGQVQSSGNVKHAALAAVDDRRARVLAHVETTFVNTEHPQGERRSYRSVVSLVWQDDRWLVENAETK